VKSPGAGKIVHELFHAPIMPRRQVLMAMPSRDLRAVMNETRRELGTPFALWRDTPSGFIEDILGESLWAKQKALLDATVNYKRVAVPAGFGVGKTHGSARLVLHFVSVYPVGEALAVTTATRFRQVRSQMWPHIRKAHARAGLPGQCDTVQYKMPDANGVDTVVAYGFSAPANDEAAMQGIHSPRLLLVVDEAGGIDRAVGGGTNNLLTGDARMLAIGNPAMNDPGSWFERLCEEGDNPDEPSTVTIPISVLDSPAITREPSPVCRDCAHNPEGHTVAYHMPNQDWVDRTIREYGSDDHPYVVAKVMARFPKDAGNKIMPASWVEAASTAAEPLDHSRCNHGGLDGDERAAGACFADQLAPGYVRLQDLGLEDEPDEWAVSRGAWVRLGVDVAADGGDEFAIYRAVGDMVQELHVASGSANADPVVVAERVLAEIDRAERLAKAIGSPAPVRVKVDKNGLGWGVVGNLERWRSTGRHHAEIVGVMVSESPAKDDEAAPMRPWRKRDEMWLAGRFLLQPDPSTGFGRLRLRVPRRTQVQLSTPDLGHNSTGFVVVETKDSMKKRGVNSPDRAEAALLALYEGASVSTKNRGLLGG
jgi:hypothetical protein